MHKKGEKLAEFGPQLEEGGYFYQTGWCGSPECENQLKQYKATIRCIIDEHTMKSCFACNTASKQDVLVGRSY